MTPGALAFAEHRAAGHCKGCLLLPEHLCTSVPGVLALSKRQRNCSLELPEVGYLGVLANEICKPHTLCAGASQRLKRNLVHTENFVPAQCIQQRR